MSVQLATRNYANNKRKNQNAFPTIKRYDIMEALLSKDIGDNYKDRLSNMFSEILYMEKENKYTNFFTIFHTLIPLISIFIIILFATYYACFLWYN